MFLLRSYIKLGPLKSSVQQCKRFKSLKVSTNSLQKYLAHLVLENETLLAKDKRSWSEIRRLREIKPVVSIASEKFILQKNIKDLEEQRKIEEDDQVKRMISEELQLYRKRIMDIDNQIETALLDPYETHSGVLLELEAVHGDNAPLLAQELHDLYKIYADFKGWDFDVVSIEQDGPGIKKSSLLLEGFGAYELMAIEHGMHHRVSSPDQETTNVSSLASVSVLPQPDVMEFDVPEKDLIIETKVVQDPADPNKTTYNSVNVTHTPSKIGVQCHTNKSNDKNEELATKNLKALLYHISKRCDDWDKVERVRKSEPIKTNSYVRTYDHARDRVLEHRAGDDMVHQLSQFLRSGEPLERLQRNLLRTRRVKLLNMIIKKYDKIQAEKDKEEVFTLY